MAATSYNRAEKIREAIFKIVERDVRLATTMRKAAEIDEEKVKLLLDRPGYEFPLTDDDGMVWKTKTEVRIALDARKPLRTRPGYMQDSASRLNWYIKSQGGESTDSPSTITLQVVIPAPGLPEPDSNVKLLRRDANGKLLSAVIDVEPKP